MLKLSLENQTDIIIESENLEKLANSVLEQEEREASLELSILLVKSDKMRNLNYKWRGRNSATDVLSFPCAIKSCGFLGDIIIDIDTAMSQKGDRKLSQEIMVLFLHGFLHLLGYDHLNQADRELMEDKEKKYRKLIKESF